RAPRARPVVRLGRRRGPGSRGDVLRGLLHHDRSPRAARDRRSRLPRVGRARVGAARLLSPRRESRRGDRPLLALRRPRLDLPVPAPLSRGPEQRMTGAGRTSPRTYTLAFAALLVLLFLTVAMARFDLGPMNLAIALTIACLKSFLVMAFFMHLWRSRKLL